MEYKKRYCPHCGNKTNDLHCDICDRNTKPTGERYKEAELNLVDDDIQMDKYNQADKTTGSNSDFIGDNGNNERNTYHKEKNKLKLNMEEGKHPYYSKEKSSNLIPEGFFKGMALLAVVVVVIVIGFIVFFMNTIE